MNIEWNHITGHFREVQGELCERINELSKRHRRIYIGVTYDPITRARYHEGKGRSRLITLWRTTSRKGIIQAEKTLISRLREDRERENAKKTLIYRLIQELIPPREPSVDNKGSGGEGIRDKREYFLYVAI